MSAERTSRPEDVRFEYEENQVVPVAAHTRSGEPYSGNAEGAVGAADWSGPFVAGRPHGAFRIFWGGIKGGTVIFERGEIVRPEQ
jgi:hypothetical protein